MRNIKLEKGKCGACGGPISVDWAGENPSLGTKCKDCSFKKPEPQVFGKDDIDLHVEKGIVFDPLAGKYEYYFEWSGTKIMVNGKEGIIRSTQGDCSWVKFDDKNDFGEPIKELGYRDLLQIYKEAGGETEPPVLDLPEHIPTPAALLDKPIFQVTVERSENGRISHIILGERYQNVPLPMARMFHAFCNAFVRFKFGLAQNLCCEGGFMGRGFEVRNSMQGFSNSQIMISVSYSSMMDQCGKIATLDDIKHYSMLQGLIDMTVSQEESRVKNDRSKILIEKPSPDLILSTWAKTMETLMRYDWTQEDFDTVGDVWSCYCKMQDVLVNVIDSDTLQQALEFAQGHTHQHCGQSY